MYFKALVITNSLKDFLMLFDQNAELKNLALGDTQHPLSGFVDEEILKGKHKVSDIVEFDYDFKGLILFQAKLGSMELLLVQESGQPDKKEVYEVLGMIKDLEVLKNRAIEENAYHPNRLDISIEQSWG